LPRQRAQFRHGSTIPGHRECLTPAHPIQYLTASISQLANCHFSHGPIVSPVRQHVKRCIPRPTLCVYIRLDILAHDRSA
jgi:hypothetical protein